MKEVSQGANRVAQPASRSWTQTQTQTMKEQSRPLKGESRRQVSPLALMEPEKEKEQRTVTPVEEDTHLQPALNPAATQTTTTFTWRRVNRTYRFPYQVEVPFMEAHGPPTLWKRNIQVEMKGIDPAVHLEHSRGVVMNDLGQRTPTPSHTTPPVTTPTVRWPLPTQAGARCVTLSRRVEMIPDPKEVGTQTEDEARTVATQVEVKAGCSWPEGLQKMQDMGLVPAPQPRTEVQTVAAYAAAGWLSPGIPRPRLPGIGWSQGGGRQPPQDQVELLGDVQVVHHGTQAEMGEIWEAGEDDLVLEAAAEEAERSVSDLGAEMAEAMDLSGESIPEAQVQQS